MNEPPPLDPTIPALGHSERLRRLYPDACRAAPTYQPLYYNGQTAEQVEQDREDGLRRLQAEITFRHNRSRK